MEVTQRSSVRAASGQGGNTLSNDSASTLEMLSTHSSGENTLLLTHSAKTVPILRVRLLMGQQYPVGYS